MGFRETADREVFKNAGSKTWMSVGVVRKAEET